MDVFEAIETTRAVRRYADTPVTDEEIARCIQAAVQGPSGGNIQPWQFLAVTDPEVKRAIGAVYRRAYARYEPAVLKVRQPLKSPEDEAAWFVFRDRRVREELRAWLAAQGVRAEPPR